MAKKGYSTLAPFDDHSFPTPNPSTRTLREFLMSMKSRRIIDAAVAPFVFESINKTDDGRVLFTFSQATMEEATTILECLPLVIQHEMHLDPSVFLTLNCLKLCQGNYYNPLTRTGITAVAACLTEEIKPLDNLKHCIPKAIHTASARDIELLFKRTENKMFTFPDDSDLASIAQSIASHKLPEDVRPKTSEQLSNLQTLLQTHHLSIQEGDDVSGLSDNSNLSFDSKASKNRYEIERHADQMANKKVDESVYQLKLKQGEALLKAGSLTVELAQQLELPYRDILEHFSSNLLEPMIEDNESEEDDSDPLQTELPDSDDMDNDSDDEVPKDSPHNSDIIHEADDDDDMNSVDTPLRGSPSKTLVAGNHNAGVKK